MSKKETQNNTEKYLEEAAALFAGIFVDLLDDKENKTIESKKQEIIKYDAINKI